MLVAEVRGLKRSFDRCASEAGHHYNTVDTEKRNTEVELKCPKLMAMGYVYVR